MSGDIPGSREPRDSAQAVQEQPGVSTGPPTQPGTGQAPTPVQWVPVAPLQGSPYPSPQTPGQVPGKSPDDRTPWHRQGWFWLIVVVVALGVITVLGIAVVGALHGLVAQSAAQTSALQKQTTALGGMGAALQGVQQSLQGITAALQAISRELAQLVGLASAHAGPAGAAGASTAAAAPTASAAP